MPSSSPAAAPARPASLVGFFAAATLLSALAFLPQVWSSHAGAAGVPAAVRPLQLLLFFGPGVLAVIWAAREDGRRGVKALLTGIIRWRVSPWWYAAVLLGPLAANLLALLLAGRAFALPAPAEALRAFAPAFLLYLLLNTEELAWRGYAWPRMRDRLGALRAALLLGAVWGILHAPLFLMKGGHPGGWPAVLFLAMTVVLSVLFALVYEGTRGSVLLVHLLHQSINAWGDTVRVYPRVTGSSVAAAAFVTVAAVVAVVGVRRAGWRWAGTGTVRRMS